VQADIAVALPQRIGAPISLYGVGREERAFRDFACVSAMRGEIERLTASAWPPLDQCIGSGQLLECIIRSARVEFPPPP
jgi:hypothetical protein